MVTANRNVSKVRKFSSMVALIRSAVRLVTVEYNFYQQIAPHVLPKCWCFHRNLLELLSERHIERYQDDVLSAEKGWRAQYKVL
jgi:hypothetical protein